MLWFLIKIILTLMDLLTMAMTFALYGYAEVEPEDSGLLSLYDASIIIMCLLALMGMWF